MPKRDAMPEGVYYPNKSECEPVRSKMTTPVSRL